MRIPYISAEIDLSDWDTDWRWTHRSQGEASVGLPFGCFDIIMVEPKRNWLTPTLVRYDLGGGKYLARASWLCFGIEMQMGWQQ